MDSITFCAHLHSTIAWLAYQLSSDASREELQHSLLHADAAQAHQQQLQSLFAEDAHQRLLVAYLQEYCLGEVSHVLDQPVCRQGLGIWTRQWVDAMR